MNEPRTTRSYDNEIAIVRENIRQLMEQAVASSGAANEDLLADRIAAQEARLASLLQQADAALAGNAAAQPDAAGSDRRSGG